MSTSRKRDVLIIDSGGANLASLQFALERLDATVRISVDPAQILQADRLLLPGVGSAGDAMRRLYAAGLGAVIPGLRQPLLGICLGMQLLYRRTAEQRTDGLGVFDGEVTALQAAPGLRVPHMGWNTLTRVAPDPLLEGISTADHFYFVHSYAAPAGPDSIGETMHGATFAAVARHENFWATQFHPERSGSAGARLLRNFLEL